MSLIGQLENVGSSLRQELLTSQEEVKIISQKLETLKTEKQTKDFTMTSTDPQDERLASAKKRESELESIIGNLEKAQIVLKTNNQRLESTVKKLNEEKIRLNLELGDHQNRLQSLKDQLAGQETKLNHVESEKKNLEEHSKINESLRETLEADLKKVNWLERSLSNPSAAAD